MSRNAITRRGSAYVLVLAVVTIAAVAGVLNIHLRARQLNLSSDLHAYAQARDAARAGIEVALARLDADPHWRTTHTSGSTLASLSTLDAAITVTIEDPHDGDLRSGDRIRLSSTATSEHARQRMSLDLHVLPYPMNCLVSSVASAKSVFVKDATITRGLPVRTPRIEADKAQVRPPVLTQTTPVGASFLGGVTVEPQTIEMPGPGYLSELASIATRLDFSSRGTWERGVLGPGINTLGGGPASPSGIYLIDCGGKSITIQKARILGTVVFINNSDMVKFQEKLRIDPADPRMPAIVSDGHLEFDIDDRDLSELEFKVSFNPKGMPWQGRTDSLWLDSYPPGIGGMVFTLASIEVKEGTTFGGPLVSHLQLQVDGNFALTINPQQQALQDPPPAFIAGEALRIDPFSIRN